MGYSGNIADARQVPEPSTRPRRLSFKDGQQAAGQTIALDEAEGIVTAIVSITGTKDEVDDVIVPGAYAKTLTKRNPKVCWAHSWNDPVGRVLHIEELLPGDERLPTQAKDGTPWPQTAGALVATMQFNMRTKSGQDAFEVVRFYSETGECEYSIGYNVPPGKAMRDKHGTRFIKALDLYELSVVLFGAHTQTGTLSIKAAVEIMEKVGTGVGTGAGTKALQHALAMQAKDGEGDAPDYSDGVMVAVYPNAEAAQAVASHVNGEDGTLTPDDLHVTLAFLGNTGDVPLPAQAIADQVSEAIYPWRGQTLTGQIAGLGVFPDAGDGAPSWAPVDVPGLGDLRAAIADRLGDMVRKDHDFTPHMTLGYDLDVSDPVPETPVTFSGVRVVYGDDVHDLPFGEAPIADTGATPATGDIQGGAPLAAEDNVPVVPPPATPAPGEEEKGMDAATRKRKPTMPGEGDRYPIGNRDDLKNAIQAYGRAKDEDKPKVKRWIVRRARELGAVDSLPDDWNVTKSLDDFLRETAIEELLARQARKAAGVDTAPVATEKLRQYWEHGEGAAKVRWGQPGDFKRCVRLISKYMDPERAKGYCANRHKGALGVWPGREGGGRKVAEYDPSLDRIEVESKWGAVPTPDGKSYPNLPGTYEERMDCVRRAVEEELRGDLIDEDREKYEWDYVNIRATWDDRVIATRHKFGPAEREETFEVTYKVTSNGVSLGEPEPVTLQIVALPDDEGDEDLPLADSMPLVEDVERVTFALKGLQTTEEFKAGRVLSGANEAKLRAAVETLIMVLSAAGVRIRLVDRPIEDEPDPRNDPDRADMTTTAPSADTSVKVLDADQLQADLASLGIDL